MAAIPGILGAVLSTKAIVVGIAQNMAQVQNAGLGFNTDLHTTALPAGGLAVDGDSVEFEYWGTIPLASVDSRIQVTLGATVIFDTGVFAPGAASWRVTGRIVRTGAATQKAIIESRVVGGDGVSYATAAETLANALDLKLKGNGTGGGDVTKEGAVVNFRGTAP